MCCRDKMSGFRHLIWFKLQSRMVVRVSNRHIVAAHLITRHQIRGQQQRGGSGRFCLRLDWILKLLRGRCSRLGRQDEVTGGALS